MKSLNGWIIRQLNWAGNSSNKQGDVMKLMTNLETISEKISSGKVGSAKPWGGANVVICRQQPNSSTEGFYPDPNFVVTNHVEKVSWLFEQIRDVFCKEDGYGYWKEELFGRLGNVIDESYSDDPHISADDLLHSIISEAIVMAAEF